MKQFLLDLRCPIIEYSQVPFVWGHSHVDRIGAVERRSVLARLHVLESVGNLGIADPKSVDLGSVDVDVPIPVANLCEVRRIGATRWGYRKIGLQIDSQVGSDVTLNL